MRLGIMQPYFLPYLGYYSLIKHTDRWIVFDTVQFIRHGWIERNRILKPGEGWQYIGVPLQKHTRQTLINDIRIRNEDDWRNKIFRQLEHYKKAPYYKATIEVLQKCFDVSTDSITKLDAHILRCTCDYLNIAFNCELFSKMNIEMDPVNDAGDWALSISKSLKAKEYINPSGGIEIFDKTKFDNAGIALKFLEINLKEYSQRRKVFEGGLSILDVMMFNNAEEINGMLDDYNFLEA